MKKRISAIMLLVVFALLLLPINNLKVNAKEAQNSGEKAIWVNGQDITNGGEVIFPSGGYVRFDANTNVMTFRHTGNFSSSYNGAFIYIQNFSEGLTIKLEGYNEITLTSFTGIKAINSPITITGVGALSFLLNNDSVVAMDLSSPIEVSKNVFVGEGKEGVDYKMVDKLSCNKNFEYTKQCTTFNVKQDIGGRILVVADSWKIVEEYLEVISYDLILSFTNNDLGDMPVSIMKKLIEKNEYVNGESNLVLELEHEGEKFYINSTETVTPEPDRTHYTMEELYTNYKDEISKTIKPKRENYYYSYQYRLKSLEEQKVTDESSETEIETKEQLKKQAEKLAEEKIKTEKILQAKRDKNLIVCVASAVVISIAVLTFIFYKKKRSKTINEK